MANGAALDFEADNEHEVTVRVTDGGGLSYDKLFRVGINNINEAPTGLTFALIAAVIAENNVTPMKVASIVVADDALGTNALGLTGADAAQFEVRYNGTTGAPELWFIGPADYELDSTLEVTVSVNDSTVGATPDAQQSFQLAVSDVFDNKSISLSNAGNLFNAGTGENWTVAGNGGNDTITTGGGADTVRGGIGDDTISTGAGHDTITFSGKGDGFDAIDGGSGFDRVIALASNTVIGLQSITGVEQISSNGFSNVSIAGLTLANTLDFSSIDLIGIGSIDGGAGNDVITGSAAADRIYGGAGDDRLIGGGGNDLLVGDQGHDTLTGGLGADTFAFLSAGDSKVGALADILTEFFSAQGDIIDLSALDASSKTKGDQTFDFIGSGAFTGIAGQLRYEVGTDGNTHVFGDTNGNFAPDFEIVIAGSLELQASNFVL